MAYIKKNESIPVKKQLLSSVLKGLTYAANTASHTALSHYKQTLANFFEYNESENIYKPILTNLKIDDEYTIPVPLITIADPRGLFLDKMDVDFSVKVEGLSELKSDLDEKISTFKFMDLDENDTNGIVGNDHSSFQISMSPLSKDKKNNDLMIFKCSFKAGETPESIMRIIDRYNNKVDPTLLKKEK